MNTRKKLKVGDVFFIPITEGLFGIGWITCKCEGSFLCEFFMPVKVKSEYIRKMLCQNSIFSKWIYSPGLKQGIEEPHDFYEIPSDYSFPYFASSYDVKEKNIYISQATSKVLEYINDKRVDVEEAKKYSLQGIALSYSSVIKSYERRLREKELFLEELDKM